MEALIFNSATLVMPIISFWFMFRFLKHISRKSEGIVLTSLLFAFIVWIFSSSIFIATGGG